MIRDDRVNNKIYVKYKQEAKLTKVTELKGYRLFKGKKLVKERHLKAQSVKSFTVVGKR